MRRLARPAALALMAALSIGPAAVALGSGQASAQAGPEVAFRERLKGAWRNVSERPGPGGTKGYVVSEVTFTDTTEEVSARAYADAALTRPLFSYRSTGPYRLLRPSAAVPGAWEADLVNERSLLTVHPDGAPLMKPLGFDDCAGLVVGREHDVSDGCAAPLFAVTRCVDQELLHVSEDGAAFRFGDSTVDRCKARPTNLDAFAYQR